MFLSFLRSRKLLCSHPDTCFYVTFPKDGDRFLECRKCGYCLSLRTYLCRTLYASRSPHVAEAYAEWSGDYNVPCCLDTVLLRNRALTNQIQTKLSTLLKGCMLLRILHVPFTHPDGTNEPTAAGITFFQETIQTELDFLVDRVSRDNEDFVGKNVGLLTHQALLFLRNLMAVELKRYFDVLVPYVQFNQPEHRHKKKLFEDFHQSFPLERALEKRMLESNFLHRTYGQSCPAFDAVHVAALCCLCKDSLEVVSDLVLEFVGKFCCGYYDTFSLFHYSMYENPLIRDMVEFFTEKKSNVRLDCFVQLFQQEDLADHFSEEFFKMYWELKYAVLHDLLYTKRAHVEWIFPRILFRDYSNYYAFLAALAYYCSETNLGSQTIQDLRHTPTPLKVISECKTVYRFIQMTLSKVKAFHDCFAEIQLQRNKLKSLNDEMMDWISDDSKCFFEKGYYWTRDMWKHFLKGHPELEKACVTAIPWLSKLALYPENEPDLKYTWIEEEPERMETITFHPTVAAPFETLYHYYIKSKTSTDSAKESCE